MLDVVIEPEKLNEATKTVMELPKLFARARSSALRSLGYHLRQELIVQGQRATKGGYLNWPVLNPHTGVLNRARRSKFPLEWKRTRWKGGDRKGLIIQRFSAQKEPLARMRSAIEYIVDEEDLFVEVGFLEPKNSSRSVRDYHKWVRAQAQGYSIQVTPRMRKKFFALGFPLRKETTQLKVPARPWVSRVEEVWRPKIHAHFETKFWNAINRYRTGGYSS